MAIDLNYTRPHLTPDETDNLGRALFMLGEILSLFDDLKSCGVECESMKRNAVQLKEQGEKLYSTFGTEAAEKKKE